jgi:hypothetical protein
MEKTATPKTRRPSKRDAERAEARTELRALLKPGDTVYTVLRHVSRSGMYRRISAYIMRDAGPEYKGKDRYYPYYLDRLLILAGIGDAPRGRGDGVGVSGCGMDMGFHLVYNLGMFTWPNGTDKPHGTRNGKPDSDGGYALQQRWI